MKNVKHDIRSVKGVVKKKTIPRTLSEYTILLTTVEGNVIESPNFEDSRCENCGKLSDEAVSCISGGYLAEGEWACCEACYDEMVEKGCAFEELGANVFRQQKY